ncbi:unnamed protein product [Adineta steineri]|uniref:Uncharacterized protein n=1 Tax=Adineta steineri TaxID=433720 RepID=A0A815QT49_9BILA|nr:unnamed protein product [Adineta steineri]CAF1634909.1 unnamed protein product [Adineta steineri]
MNWTYWLLDYAEFILVFSHEADLLSRLLRDIATYYTKIGKISLKPGLLVEAHRALTYLDWARTLLFRADKIDPYKDLKTIRDVENLIGQAEEMIDKEESFIDDYKYVEDDLERSLNNGIFIYHSKEYQQEATQLLTILHNLTNEQGALLDNYTTFITKFQDENCAAKHYCPIIIASNNINLAKIFADLSSLASIHQIYVLKSSEYTAVKVNDRTLLEQFLKVRNVYSQAKILALEWTAARASVCEEVGELCTENNNDDLARRYYTKAIELNERLAAFITKK